MNASYDILQAIKSKPPIVEVGVKKVRKQVSRDDKAVMDIIKKLSADELAKLLKM